ncbi:MFS transporter [Capnocytophaga cynodegmi]|uniref:MFS transporter n=1 Tax=Capnocytophaga cynodegmi TaxID=28189 RepID=UPI001EE363C8|nr:MFS transporter [Capnocytophaga cynodegmi]GJQ06223.1 MFS transporter [Capnocytophaga cynodegmi]
MPTQFPRGHKKLLKAWILYDWANSVYSLTIVSAVFPIFYGLLFKIAKITHIEIFGISFKNTAVITFVTSLAFLVVVLVSPILSGIADYLGNKKTFMKFFCYLGAISCIGLYWFSLENIYFGLTCYFLGVVGFWGSIVFYNSYLPDIALPEQYDEVSAKGFIMGYLGCTTLLIFNLAMVMYPSFFGIRGDETQATLTAMKISFVTVGIWWITFSQYSFRYLPDFEKGRGKINKNIIFNGYKELRGVWRRLKESNRLKMFLFAFFVYSMGVQTIMLVATYFGEQEIRWKGTEERTLGLIISILIIQIVAIFGARLTVVAVKKMGQVPVLIILNCIWIVICLVAYFIYLPVHFYITAMLVGMVMGGIQTLSRSTYSNYLPETKDTTSFFSFFDVAEKIGIVIGMGIYGFIDQFTNNMRNSVVFLVLFFGFGVFLLLKVLRMERRKAKLEKLQSNCD